MKPATKRKMTTWQNKLNQADEPVVKPCPVAFAGMKPGQLMLVPTARLIDDFIRALPAGTSMTTQHMRQALAKQHGAEVTCPVTTGFHLRTVAEAAVESGGDEKDMTPFWRVIDPRSPTFAKLSFDTDLIRHHRRLESL
jgi:hypothetical protein